MEKIKVLFRKDDCGEITAYFPEISQNRNDPMICLCYSHIGQHSSAHIEYIQTETKPCTDDEYKNLLSELINEMGYTNLKIIKRMSREMHEKRIENIS